MPTEWTEDMVPTLALGTTVGTVVGYMFYYSSNHAARSRGVNGYCLRSLEEEHNLFKLWIQIKPRNFLELLPGITSLASSSCRNRTRSER